MKRTRYSITQAAVVIMIGVIAAFVHNAFSINGINPFRHIGEVPVIDEQSAGVDVDGIRLISLEELREAISGGKTVIDARTAAEYEEGHIPGAILLDYYELGRYLSEVVPLLSYEEDIVVYCAGPLCEDSEMLARELYTLGYKRMMVYKGGIEGWQEAGLPLVEGI